ncbi:di-heme oxidoredictase family protein [Polaribacter sp. KT25b]|uniref:di-heme oxidoreductase family protein n=1 Tax=Polaribacter sp. KT25b TaxID=1855336 RepID=UPI000B87FBF8|nr:di-heme oxidoredictase family protein [Polaribacter sp. KT25b]
MTNKTKPFLILLILIMISCSNNEEIYIPLVAEENEAFSGGETTIFDVSVNAFGFQAPNLVGDNSLFFFTGNSLFNQNWVTAPASTTARDGLGPFFNARACSTCHFKDGRGKAPESIGDLNHGLLLRLSIPGTDLNGGNKPDPIYGGQLQDQSVTNTTTEASFSISYSDKIVNYSDGTSVTLRNPEYIINDLAYGNLASNLQVSPRVAQQMVGLGLLEAVTENTLLSFADEFDTDNDGVSGRPNYVWNIETQSTTIGRFGWKANQPTIKQQISAAFAGDLGITSTLFPDENCPEGVDCSSFANGGSPEISDENIGKVTLYSSTLAVPGRRDYDEINILEGKKLFIDSKCTSCHIAKMTTGSHEIPALENQTIRPYTDLLLHDMGVDLADNTPDFKATGTEWRTPPLWGIGLIETVNGHTNLLHDGRARTIEEAILWHGGEAENSKNIFVNLTSEERTKIIDFIKTL